MATAKKEQQSEVMLNLYQRLSKITAEIEAIPKLNRNEHGKFNYVSHDQITEALRPLFVKYGVQPIISVKKAEFTQPRIREDDVVDPAMIMMTVTCNLVNIDNPEDSLAMEVVHTNPAMGGKESGAALSYCTKYAYSKLFLISGCSAELDAENPVGTTKAKKKGIVSEKQSRFLWVQAEQNDVPAPKLRMKLMLLGFKSSETLTVKAFEEILDWVRGGGEINIEAPIPSTAVPFFEAYCKEMKTDVPSGLKDFTIAEWAQSYKAIKDASDTTV